MRNKDESVWPSGSLSSPQVWGVPGWSVANMVSSSSASVIRCSGSSRSSVPDSSASSRCSPMKIYQFFVFCGSLAYRHQVSVPPDSFAFGEHGAGAVAVGKALGRDAVYSW